MPVIEPDFDSPPPISDPKPTIWTPIYAALEKRPDEWAKVAVNISVFDLVGLKDMGWVEVRSVTAKHNPHLAIEVWAKYTYLTRRSDEGDEEEDHGSDWLRRIKT